MEFPLNAWISFERIKWLRPGIDTMPMKWWSNTQRLDFTGKRF
jgi:hypothetical protein